MGAAGRSTGALGVGIELGETGALSQHWEELSLEKHSVQHWEAALGPALGETVGPALGLSLGSAQLGLLGPELGPAAEENSDC
jgi:hypothetical protein